MKKISNNDAVQKIKQYKNISVYGIRVQRRNDTGSFKVKHHVMFSRYLGKKQS